MNSREFSHLRSVDIKILKSTCEAILLEHTHFITPSIHILLTFLLQFWNHWDTGSNYRTTNHCEGFHNRLNSHFHAKPSLFQLHDVLLEIQATTERETLLRQIHGNVQPFRKPAQIEKEEAIIELRRQLQTNSINSINFLDEVSPKIFRPAV